MTKPSMGARPSTGPAPTAARAAPIKAGLAGQQRAPEQREQQIRTGKPEHASSVSDPNSTGLSLIMRLEALVRACADLIELGQLIANETRKINRARQIFVVKRDPTGSWAVSAVTGVATPDAQSALVGGVCDIVDGLTREKKLGAAFDFTLPAYAEPQSDIATSYPFREICWFPFMDRKGDVFAGMICARETPWSKDDIAITQRLAATFAHGWREIATAGSFRRKFTLPRWKTAAVIATAIALAFPVPITALAPAEIVAADPLVIAAPIDGVIDQVVVDPSATVAAGDILVRLADTALRNRAQIAQREVAVAEAKLKQATMLAFADARGRHELGIAQAELELKRADLALASEQLQRTVIRSTRAGIAVYSDRRQLIGKPVSTGERIMEIADPNAIEVRIDLAVPDAMALKPDSYAKLFLDVDPLRPIASRVVRSDYQARASDTDVLSFRTFAHLASPSTGAAGESLRQIPTRSPAPRIGLRGTAQVWGDSAPLLIVLLRRPISAARQWIGL